jgi:Viral BACON domain/Putative binding domain, N-terminal
MNVYQSIYLSKHYKHQKGNTMKKTLVSAFGFIVLMVTAITWAAPVPDTGQTKCYNATVEIPCPAPGQPFYGQDANYTINPMSYTKLDGSGNVLPDSACFNDGEIDILKIDPPEGTILKVGQTYTFTVDISYKLNTSPPARAWAGAFDAQTGINIPQTQNLVTITSNEGKMTLSLNADITSYDGKPINQVGVAAVLSNDTFSCSNIAKDVFYFTDALQPVLSVTPSNQAVSKDAGATTFSVSNTGTGTMPWTAAVTLGDSWLWIPPGTSGTDNGTINCSFTANTSSAARTGTIRVTASGATGSPVDVTVTQAPTPAQPVLLVTPASRDVAKDAGATTFSVSVFSMYSPSGPMPPWAATVTSGDSWLLISAGAIGTNSGTITCSFTANTSSAARTATIRVTATGATGSPVDVTVTQAPTPVQLMLSVTPPKQAVSNDAGATTFSVSNTGTGNMQWTAAVTSGGNWLAISSGASGTNSGTINCSFTANASTSSRTATIRVTATGTTGSPVDITVTQPTVCTVTLDGNLMLHIPILASINDWWWAPAYSADFVYEYNPTYPALIILKMTNVTMRTTYIPECEKEESTYTDDYFTIHIPGLLLADGITRLSVDMEYSPAFSTNGNICFVVTKIENI